jgi:hypothetical protein
MSMAAVGGLAERLPEGPKMQDWTALPDLKTGVLAGLSKVAATDFEPDRFI